MSHAGAVDSKNHVLDLRHPEVAATDPTTATCPRGCTEADLASWILYRADLAWLRILRSMAVCRRLDGHGAGVNRHYRPSFISCYACLQRIFGAEK